jgi:hypothetical protein
VTSIAFPVFALGRDPTRKIMVVAGNRKLVKELEARVRTLMRSPKCLALFPHLKFDARAPHIQLAAGGQLTFSIFGRSIIGRGGDIIIVDDPISPADSTDDQQRSESNEWFKSDLLPRLNDHLRGVIIVVMQRLHPDDLSGMLLSGKEKWDHICFAAIARNEEEWSMPDGTVRTRWKGEPLHPKVMNRAFLLQTLGEVRAVNFAAQYQQDPSWIRSEWESGCFVTHPRDESFYDDWTLEKEDANPIGWFFGKVATINYVLHYLFGIGERPPVLDYRNSLEMPMEQWVIKAQRQQRRLLAEVEADWERSEARRKAEEGNSIISSAMRN